MKIRTLVDEAISRLSPKEQYDWDALKNGDSDPIDTLDAWNPEHRLAVRRALAEYAVSRNDAREVLREIISWSPRIGALLACVVAREALRYVPHGEHVQRHAIEASERWARGECTAGVRRTYAHAAYAASTYDSSDAVFATDAAFNAALAPDSPQRAADVAFDVAAAVCSAHCDADFGEVLSSLCVVIAESLREGSVGEWIG